jgi:hypothetical protein
MQQIKGAVLKSRLAFVEEHGGKNGIQQVLAALPAADQRTLKMLFTSNWYPFGLGRALDDAIVRVLGGGRAEFFERLGEASAEKNLGTVHSGYLTRGDAHGFLAKSPSIYSLYYEAGRREYKQAGPREGVLTTYDAETFSAPDCLTVSGGIGRPWRCAACGTPAWSRRSAGRAGGRSAGTALRGINAGYSDCSASVGATRVARRAGMNIASAPTTTRIAAAPTNATGSVAVTS